MKTMERPADFGRPAPVAADPGAAHTAARPVRARFGVDRYSRRVALMKRVLPVIGATLLLLVAMWPRLVPLIESVRQAVSAIDLREARELKMIDPRYAGTDRLNRPFVVTAAVGRQVPSRSDLMSLEDPKAVMIVHPGARVVLTAATGIYQSQAQLLDLFDNVVLTHQNGTRFVTRRAHANLAADTAEGHDPIEGHGPSGDIWGQGFHVVDKGDTIIFTGRSHAILRGTKSAKPASPPQLPPGVVSTAAAIEAAATAPANSPAAAVQPAPAAANPAEPAPAATADAHRPAVPSDTARTPVVQTPVVQTPVVQTPVVQTPVVRAPAAQAPAAATRAARHFAPGHVARGHSSSGHFAPGHSARGHSAPGHFAPGHFAPGYSAGHAGDAPPRTRHHPDEVEGDAD
jgi:lipopolysaccharide export system protein LptC